MHQLVIQRLRDWSDMMTDEGYPYTAAAMLLTANEFQKYINEKGKHVGIIAETMAEVVERTLNDVGGAVTELRKATSIQLVTGAGGLVWINVDGVLALRIQVCQTVYVDTSLALETAHVLK